jgi:hypothetical protein
VILLICNQAMIALIDIDALSVLCRVMWNGVLCNIAQIVLCRVMWNGVLCNIAQIVFRIPIGFVAAFGRGS